MHESELGAAILLFLVRLRNANQSKLAGAEQTSQPDGVTLVDFDVVGRVQSVPLSRSGVSRGLYGAELSPNR